MKATHSQLTEQLLWLQAEIQQAEREFNLRRKLALKDEEHELYEELDWARSLVNQ